MEFGFRGKGVPGQSLLDTASRANLVRFGFQTHLKL
jgi:hypothetical protein